MDRDLLKEKIITNKITSQFLKQILTQTDRHVDALLPYYIGSDGVRQNKALLIEGMLGLHMINQSTPLSVEYVFLKWLDRENIDSHYSDFADKEIRNDFSTLIANSTITLFTIFDATLKNFVLGWYLNHYSSLTKNVKDRAGKFPEDVNEHDANVLWYRLCDVLKADAKRLKKASPSNCLTIVDYAELNLEFLGLEDNKLDFEVKRNLDELCYVRNLIVHNNLTVNARFKNNECPWIDIEVGEQMKLKLKDYERYDEAVRIYFGCLLDRIVQFYSDGQTHN